ncbi:MAG: GNAT family N-acetyltransferase [Candidatus Limnocylindria bacterium]
MRIVRATREHAAALTQLMARSPLLRRYGVTRHRAWDSLGEALRERDQLLVALENGEVVGLAWMIATRALDRAAYLRLLLVAQGKQSHGVGAALLEEGERRVHKLGCRHMVLLVTTTNRRARSFYEAQGYRHVGNLPGFVRPAIGESLYVKTWSARR